MALVTVGKLAKIMKLSPRRIQQLVDEGMPRDARGKYDAEVCLTWYVDFLKESSAGGSGNEDYKKALTERLIWQAKRAKLEYEQLEGSLVYAKDVEVAAFETARLVRDKIQTIPNRVSAILAAISDPVKVREILEKEIRIALETLSKEFEEKAK